MSLLVIRKDIAGLRKAGIAEANRLVGAVRASFVTVIPAQDMVYLEKAGEARRFLVAYPTPEDVPAEVLEKEKEIYKDQARASGKPDHIIDKIAEGKLESYYEMACLYDQKFVKDPNITVKELINSLVGKIGENIQVRRFTRFKTGEGLEKRSTDLAGEVAAALGE